MFRRLRVLAAFALVPVVFFASPASAAGPWVTLTATGGPGGVVECTVSLQQFGAGSSALNVSSNGYCTGGPDISPGSLQAGESGVAYTMTVSGTSPSGSACSGSATSSLGQHPANGTVRVAGSIPGGVVNTSSPDCSITRVVFDWPTDGAANVDTASAVVDIPATDGPPPPTGGACVHGTPSLTFEWRDVGAWAYGGGYRNWELWLSFSVAGAGVSTAQWGAAVLGNYGRGPGTPLTSTEVLFKRVEGELVPPATPTGVEVYATPDDWNNELLDPYANVVGNTRPTGRNQDFSGWTQPSHCRFYFGTPVANDGAASDEDVPFGDGQGTTITPPVDPEPVLDPPPTIDTSGSDWLALIWGVLKSILTTIGGLASSIVSGVVNGIGDLLNGLFIPSDGFLSGKWAGVESKWAGTSPGKYLDAVTGLAPGSVSGCSGLPLQVTLPGGVQVDQHIGAACTGSMASAAGMTRAALSVVFLIGGTIACLRAVGSGLGWNPGIGRSVDA